MTEFSQLFLQGLGWNYVLVRVRVRHFVVMVMLFFLFLAFVFGYVFSNAAVLKNGIDII